MGIGAVLWLTEPNGGVVYQKASEPEGSEAFGYDQ